jgi:3-deoxy-manno-octulosonate cytidylyltransferase (CMP-KDO synthetase)
MSICALIPARFNSKRLYGKPLLQLKNKEILLRTYENVKKVFKEKDIYIFTDKEIVKKKMNYKIKNIIVENGNFKNGTERLSKGIYKIKKDYKAGMIISCDNSFINKNTITSTIKSFNEIKNNNLYFGSTVHKKETDKSIFLSKSTAKVVLDKKNDIMYLSRSPIPTFNKTNFFFTHHGPVCVKMNLLKKFIKWNSSILQLREDNEWLKILENGYKIRSRLIKNINPEINTIKDIRYYKKILYEK